MQVPSWHCSRPGLARDITHVHMDGKIRDNSKVRDRWFVHACKENNGLLT